MAYREDFQNLTHRTGRQGLELGLKLELCNLTNGLWRFYLLQNPKIKFNKMCGV